MKAFVLSGLFAAVLAATTGERPVKFNCGTGRPSQNLIKAHQSLRVEEAALTARGQVSRAQINVDVYVHVVARDKTVKGGYISRDTVNKQIAVINDNFAPSGISFSLKDADWTINKSWTDDRDEIAMKTKLRKGSYSDLNLYYLNTVSGPPGTLGYCYFPTDAQEGSEDFIIDGCSLNVGSVPGGSINGFNLGKTTTHEVGHWFGLLHTFDGDSCRGAGDEIDDTPQQASSSEGCPTGRDSCPNLPGLDPIHNYMDYTTDACYEEFSTGQNNRMKSMWNKYRG